MILRTTSPFNGINDDLTLSANQRSVMIKNKDQFVKQTFVDPRILGDKNDPLTRFNANFLHRSLIYVITETVGDYPYPYFSEKTWKAMVTGCPFMMVNACNSLAKLRDFGFKTFANWWDESYDTKSTVADRIEAMTEVLKSLSRMPINELQNLRAQIEPTIKHNQQHLKVFTTQDLKNITNTI